MTNEKKSKTSDELHPTLAEAYLGVWRIVYTRGAFSIPGKGIIHEGKKAYEYTQAYIIPFLSDIRRILGTKFFVLYLFHHFWWGIEGALLLYLLSGLLHQVIPLPLSTLYAIDTCHSRSRLHMRTEQQTNGLLAAH